MAFGSSVRVWGDFACFTRPEMKVERVSYEVITPSAARGVLEAIYWKPQIRWVVDKIQVIKPIRFLNLRRNELGSKFSADAAKSVAKLGAGTLGMFIEEERQQRAALILRDVEYHIHAHIDLSDESEPIGKHLDTFRRRVERGQCFHRPYLGCREFPAEFGPLSEPTLSHPDLKGSRSLGYMLWDIDFQNDMRAHFFDAKMVDGTIIVPPFASEELVS